MATKLERVQINEVSGVDEPANTVPGWLVMKSTKRSLLRKVNDPVRLTDGRIVGRVVGFEGKGVSVDWINDEVRDLAKQGRLEGREDGIYLVGSGAPIGVGSALLAGKSVVLS
jgi:hypothetical protein